MKRRMLQVGVIAVLTLVFLACVTWWAAMRISERERTKWKGPALERLANQLVIGEQIRAELESLQGKGESNWVGDKVLLMEDGAFIIYEYRHGRNDYFPPHLFLGHGSDGRWLYSSYHFCNSMAMVAFDPRPKSIAEFCQKYSVREFDGKSDSCLKVTQ